MFKCELVERTSKKGSKFTCLEVTFPNGYKKLVFLETAEIYMAQQFLE